MSAVVTRFKAWRVRCNECNAESLADTKAHAEARARDHNKMAHAPKERQSNA